ncbi:unnamed protein product [Callosobruchus maculatus]|uniref:Uncharacterized protein n=1 Tax=Callosobruchus maculatus TaxID=64391 RepID=A0A653BRT3_CALMS|nr:unnamed protein product [Callosobruchus maculatus]
MENLITQMVKFLSSTVVVHIYSFPNFSIETFLASIVCVVHVLLIHEVNSLYRRTNAKAAAKLRLRHASIKAGSIRRKIIQDSDSTIPTNSLARQLSTMLMK